MRNFKIALLKEKIYLMLDVESCFRAHNKETLYAKNSIRKMTIKLIKELDELTGEQSHLYNDGHLKLMGKI